jgi:hypothetical protein
MKHILTTISCLLLGACASQSIPQGTSAAFPVAITQLTSSVAPVSGQLEVQITIKNSVPRTLKTLRVFVAAYTTDGTKASMADESIEILGPINRGQSIGPLEKVTSIRDRNVSCVEVVRVEAVMMDYATSIASGDNAKALVTDENHRPCSPGSR